MPSASQASGHPSSAAPLAPVEALPGLATLSEVGPRTGSAIAGRIQAKPGELWLNITCRGRGEIVVAFEPMDKLSVPCTDAGEKSRNQINLKQPHELKIVVTAPGGVEWALLAQQ